MGAQVQKSKNEAKKVQNARFNLGVFLICALKALRQIQTTCLARFWSHLNLRSHERTGSLDPSADRVIAKALSGPL